MLLLPFVNCNLLTSYLLPIIQRQSRGFLLISFLHHDFIGALSSLWMVSRQTSYSAFVYALFVLSFSRKQWKGCSESYTSAFPSTSQVQVLKWGQMTQEPSVNPLCCSSLTLFGHWHGWRHAASRTEKNACQNAVFCPVFVSFSHWQLSFPIHFSSFALISFFEISEQEHHCILMKAAVIFTSASQAHGFTFSAEWGYSHELKKRFYLFTDTRTNVSHLLTRERVGCPAAFPPHLLLCLIFCFLAQ